MQSRKLAWVAVWIFGLVIGCGEWMALRAESPWASLIPFRKGLPTDRGSFELTQDHGPWLILAASFSGPKAEEQAETLVRELRAKHRLLAYLHRQSYDFSKPTEGSLLNERGDRARMRYVHNDKYDAFGVLVGDFRSVDEPALEEALERIKYMKPECLDIEKNRDSSQTFVGIKQLYQKISGDPARVKRGPMGSAFATRNPLLPDEFFAVQGVDDFVARLNDGVEFCLLDNPGKYTVRVATFRGATSINQREIAELERSNKVSDKLAVAADKAHRLTVALRKHGVEAYEFHDRYESVVTIGSFESEGTPLIDGSIDINPQMLRIIQQYRASHTPIPGRRVVGMQPKVLDGITFDVQPLPMAVPRRSFGADYARR